ncbi:MAG: hydrogenase [Desulfobacterales bacterium]|nr:hydrogenase [Desulfobacterales bacterium]
MIVFLLSVIIIVASGFAALVTRRSNSLSTFLGVGGVCAGSLIGLIPTFNVLIHGSRLSLHLPWHFAWGSFFVEIDPLSSFFLIPVFGVSILTAVYGAGYLQHYRQTHLLGVHWFFFNLLVAGMAMVAVAGNGVLFLISWEVMSLAPFFLVTFHSDQSKVQHAGWVYLVATHLGAIFLLVFFLLMGVNSGSMDFDHFNPSGYHHLSLLFLLAVIGFGSKSGFIPFHVWLPEAHPAAPSHVSALMSGVMIKMGIYGLFRSLVLLGVPSVGWGYVFIGIGLISGIAGVTFALAQHDLKRLLAYHSVENIGIISIGIGIGMLGLSWDNPVLVVMGMGGALLHVLNHSLFKSLLFLGAGSVQHASGTLEIEHMGGLLKRMPITGMTFLVGAAAICGLPPLNGFISEFLIYQGSVYGSMFLEGATVGAMPAVIAGLALIGGLAAICFTKAFGIVFLGTARREKGVSVRESRLSMKIPMLILSALCLLCGLLGADILKTAAPVLNMVTMNRFLDAIPLELIKAANSLRSVTWVFAGLILILTGLIFFRKWLLSKRYVQEGVTWDCGYIRPTSRMQYTASSFVQPVTGFFRNILQTRNIVSPPHGLFPTKVSLTTKTPDVFEKKFYSPLFEGTKRILFGLRWIQQGRIQLYIAYIVITLIILLIWKVR